MVTANYDPGFINLEFFFLKLYEFFVNAPAATPDLSREIFWFKIILSVLTVVFAAGVVVLFVKLFRLRRTEIRDFVDILESSVKDKQFRNRQWEQVRRYIDSCQPSDWTLAIIEADKLLDQLLRNLRYGGENLGERLKTVDRSDFLTLDDAWEAHKFRNRIAHEANMIVTEREAKRVISLYEKVFREFDYI